MLTTFLITFLILERLPVRASNNACENPHLQTVFCRNEKVLKVQVYGPEHDKYMGTVLEYFKGDWRGLVIWHPYRINMITNASLDNETVVMFGHSRQGNFIPDSCSGIVMWNNLTSFQKMALFGLYEHGCDCVYSLPGYNGPFHNCYWKYTFVYKDSRTDTCHYSENQNSRACINKIIEGGTA